MQITKQIEVLVGKGSDPCCWTVGETGYVEKLFLKIGSFWYRTSYVDNSKWEVILGTEIGWLPKDWVEISKLEFLVKTGKTIEQVAETL